MKIIYCGTDVYLPIFEYFLKNHEILALYTYHNDEDYFSEDNIVQLAREHNISVHYESVSEYVVRDYFKNKGCELLICCEYAHIIPIPNDIPNFRGVNVHGSLLPEGRGYYPIEMALDKNLDYAGVTMHKIFSQVDRGDIIYQEEIDLHKYNDSVEVYLKAANIVGNKIKEIMENFDEYWENATIQNEVKPYWKRPELSHITLNQDLTVEEAIRIKQKFNKMTEVVINNVRYYVRSMETSLLKIDKIIKVEDDLYLYPCKDGYLRLIVQKVK